MAIIDGVPGVEVTVCVDDVPLREYPDDEEDDLRTASRYVESTSQKEFTIHIEVTEAAVFKSDVLAFEVYVDGEFFKSRVFRGPRKTVLDGLYFTALEMVSDDLKLDNEDARVGKLGIVKVEMYHAQDLGDTPKVPRSSFHSESGGLGIISEKALKGIPRYKDAKASMAAPPGFLIQVEYINGDEADATSLLQYRSLECLKSLLLVERTPPPIPLEERDFDSLSQEELRQLRKNTQERARAEKAAKEARAKVKSEEEDINPRQRKKVRPDPSAAQLELDETGDGFRAISKADPTRPQPMFIELD